MRILRGLSSRRLPCGCIVGIYITYTADIVVILDSRDTACASDDHLPGRQIAIDQPRHDRAS